MGNELAFVPQHFGEGSASTLRKLVTKRVATFFFDNRGYHAQPIYLNAINNAILRANVAKLSDQTKDPASFGITVFNHPLNGTDKANDQDMA